ncbi:hypothetical protein EZL74_10280 [Flavobacterium silvisoli]|uniref:Uncharacterized protein n=1 Tax=Flavobacterium silvisoli TaxID=2529433 RepID=A0A4Q9YW84_9FLAO|nr:hypothetical protein [Flavobacterium silvisoli]TBX67036.1 hypothetical protein EZL74_10280 [Flavobacterium silvisoli]
METIFLNAEDHKLEYFNTIGLLFQNHVYLNKNDELLEFDIKEIKRIYFRKQRDLKDNYCLFILSAVLAGATLYLGSYLSQNYKLPILIISGLLLLFSFLKKSYHYEIFLMTANHNFTAIEVNEANKDQACELISHTKRKMKKMKLYQQAG